MSFSASLRRCAPSVSRAARQEASPRNASASSSARAASKTQTQQRTLPPQKLRALISLYHQSDTFITQENLIQRINEALVPQSDTDRPTIKALMPDMHALREVLSSRHDAPKFGQPDELKMRKEKSSDWSMGRPSRERRVIEAMYGLDMGSLGRTRPGLESLEDAVRTLREEEVEDARRR